ncbi:MAG: leucine-rich repeat domain-containing protein [Bacteroidetes bacterium]|nr:leucine-rich repeat domain-containing protein [Bacteroidota bacterium]
MKRRLIILFALIFNLSLLAQISEIESAALVDLYTTTAGDNWNQKWDLNQEVSNWPGVTVKNGHVTEIRMLFNNLTGSLPASLSDLTKLKVLELSFNNLSGEIPFAIGALKNLEVLALNGNYLSGAIPNSICYLTNLKQLHLSSNKLSGDLPSEINRLTNLEVFNVFDNDLSGKIPLELASNRNLREFLVAENNFDNASEISTILLINSGGHLNLKQNTILNPAGKSIIALETSEDEN